MTIIAILLAFALCHFVRDLGRFRQDRWLRSWVNQAGESLSGLPGWSGVILGSTCLLQFAISVIIDSRYEPRTLGRYYYWMIWYPMIYWAIHAAASVAAVPTAIRKRRGSRAIWVSPDRGVRPETGD